MGHLKGLAILRKGKGTHHQNTQRRNAVETKLNLITKKAKESKELKFNNILHLLKERNLAECLKELKRGKAVGVDGVSLEEYEKELDKNLEDLVKRMKAWKYKPKPVRRVYIEKGNGKKRPLGIPSVEDKVVQMGIKKILEAIFEADFLDFSYGFRPGRSCHQALNRLDKMIMKNRVNYVIDADIRGFFDNIDHKWLRRCLEERISDRNFLRLMIRVLKGGVMEEGIYIESEKGTPQGAILSPILANIYLHYILDLWIARVVRKECKGYVGIVRYADDFIICVEREEEAESIMNGLRERLSKFGLEMSEEKSKIARFGRRADKTRGNTFNFLGFTHFNDRTRRGNYKVGRKTDRKRFRRAVTEMNQWLKRVRNASKVKGWWKILISKIRGHLRYYGISGNMLWLKKYMYIVTRLVFKWLNRMSQKRKYKWERYKEYLNKHPLPKPRIYFNLYTLYGY